MKAAQITQYNKNKMPGGLDFDVAAAIPLTGLTAYQAITESVVKKIKYITAV